MSDEEKTRMRNRFQELLGQKTLEYQEAVSCHAISMDAAADAILHDVLCLLACEFSLRYYRIMKRHGFPPWLYESP
jgi:hypothetical protein